MKSTINLNSINRSLSGLSESVKNANERSEKISDNIADRNLTKGLEITEKDIWARRPGTGEIPAYEFDKVIAGVAIKAPENLLNFSENILVRLYDKQNKFVGLGETKGNKVFPKRLINTKNIRE